MAKTTACLCINAKRPSARNNSHAHAVAKWYAPGQWYPKNTKVTSMLKELGSEPIIETSESALKHARVLVGWVTRILLSLRLQVDVFCCLTL
eukprot:1849422-Amphidinium_carterae.1